MKCQKRKLITKRKSNKSKRQRFGFVCPMTKIFYECPDQQTYKILLKELKDIQKEQKLQKLNDDDTQMVSQESQENQAVHFQQVSNAIMEIFNDPSFNTEVQQVQMKMIDF